MPRRPTSMFAWMPRVVSRPLLRGNPMLTWVVELPPMFTGAALPHTVTESLLATGATLVDTLVTTLLRGHVNGGIVARRVHVDREGLLAGRGRRGIQEVEGIRPVLFEDDLGLVGVVQGSRPRQRSGT